MAPFDEHPGAENPYTLHAELQESMNDLVGIIRKQDEIEAALARTGGVVAEAAHSLGLSRQALYRRMEKYGIDVRRE